MPHMRSVSVTYLWRNTPRTIKKDTNNEFLRQKFCKDVKLFKDVDEQLAEEWSTGHIFLQKAEAETIFMQASPIFVISPPRSVCG